jgi:hypothetical protein
MASEIKVDTISEKTSANGVTIDGYKLKDGAGTMVNAALQVVTQQAAVDLSGDAAEIDITPLDVTITPSSTSSAIMVALGSIPIQVVDRNDNNYWGMKIYRTIGSGSASVIYTNSQMGRATSERTTEFSDGKGFSFIDKPSTTSQCVYEFRFVQSTGGSSENSSIGKGMTCTSYGIEFSGATEV